MEPENELFQIGDLSQIDQNVVLILEQCNLTDFVKHTIIFYDGEFDVVFKDDLNFESENVKNLINSLRNEHWLICFSVNYFSCNSSQVREEIKNSLLNRIDSLSKNVMKVPQKILSFFK